jgi:hypothetical protein
MRRAPIVLLALLAVTCSTSTTPPTTPGRPDIGFRIKSPIFFGSAGTAPINVELEIQNVAKVPVELRRVAIRPGPGMTQYSVEPYERTLAVTIAPGEIKTFDVPLSGYTNAGRLQVIEPLALRAFLDFDMGGKRFREMYTVSDITQ